MVNNFDIIKTVITKLDVIRRNVIHLFTGVVDANIHYDQ